MFYGSSVGEVRVVRENKMESICGGGGGGKNAGGGCGGGIGRVRP